MTMFRPSSNNGEPQARQDTFLGSGVGVSDNGWTSPCALPISDKLQQSGIEPARGSRAIRAKSLVGLCPSGTLRRAGMERLRSIPVPRMDAAAHYSPCSR